MNLKNEPALWLLVLLLVLVAFGVVMLVPRTVSFEVRGVNIAQAQVVDNPPLPIVVSPVQVEVPQVLLDISWCESRDRQFNPDGTVLKGVVNPKDIGRWQINEYWHLEEAKRLGIDIYTESGNRDFALLLYNRNGTRDWNASRECWSDIEAWKQKQKSYY